MATVRPVAGRRRRAGLSWGPRAHPAARGPVVAVVTSARPVGDVPFVVGILPLNVRWVLTEGHEKVTLFLVARHERAAVPDAGLPH